MFPINNSLDIQEESLISSLQKQPIIVVLRPNEDNLCIDKSFFSTIQTLHLNGIKHIEIAWTSDARWRQMMKNIIKEFRNISFGIASISSPKGLQDIEVLPIKYAMSPIFDKNLQNQAKKNKLLLIPGVFTPSEIKEATSYGCKIIKLFPAINLGIEYINQIKIPLNVSPFIIAAGGLSSKDIISWLNAGYNTVAIGRNLIQHGKIDPSLDQWIKLNAK